MHSNESAMHYVKMLMLKKIMKLIDEGYNSAEELMLRSGLSENDFEKLISLLLATQESGTLEGTACLKTFIDEEDSIAYKITQSGRYVMDNDLFYTLKGFNDIELFDKEIDILVNGDPLEFLLHTLGKIHVGDKHLAAINICVGLTPWFETDTLHFYPVGKSGGGKSSLCSKVLHLFPKGFVEVISSSSPKALYYAWLSGSLNMNKIIFLDDIEAGKDFIDVIKAFTSASIVKPRHWTLDIHRKFLDIKPDKMYSIWLTSVNPINDDQLKNRFIIGNIDDSEEQDKQVNEHIKRLYRLGLERQVAADSEFQMAKNILNIILSEPKQVLIPYDISFPIIFDRRSLPFFMIVIKSIAFLNKFQREIIDNKIIATFADFKLARMLWESIIEYQSSKVSKDSLMLLNILPDSEEEAMTRSQLATALKVSTKTIERRTRELMSLDLIFANQKSNRVWHYWKNTEVVKRRMGNKKITIISNDKKKLYKELELMGIAEAVYNEAKKARDSKGKRITNPAIIKKKAEARMEKIIASIMGGQMRSIEYLSKFTKPDQRQQTLKKVLTADKFRKFKEDRIECTVDELKAKYNFTDEEIQKLLNRGMIFEVRPEVFKAV